MTHETLAKRLADEDVSAEGLDALLQKKKEKLNKLSEEGKAVKKISSLTEEVSALEEIVGLRDYLATAAPAVVTDSPELMALKEELVGRLADEDIADVPALLKKIEKKSASVLELRAKGATKKAEKLEAELAELNVIKEMADRVATLGGVSVSAPMAVSASAGAGAGVAVSASVQAPPLPVPSRATDFFASRVVSAVASQAPVVGVKPPKLERSQSFEELQEIQASFAALEAVPECAEKSLAKLCGHFQNEVKKKARLVEPLLTAEEILAVFENLKLQLAQEQLNDFSVNEKLKAIEAILTSADATVLSGEFWKLLKEIQPLDMELMLGLIAKTKEAAKRIESQDIILLLGGTGAGKSTTIHWLGGSTMKKTFVGGLKHIAPVEVLGSELESVTTSPFTRSETRSINAVKVDLDKMGLASSGEVVLCDTPGFGDTNGPEVDIANGSGVVDAVCLCHSVKILILISMHSIGDRLEGIGKLSRILVTFIGSIQDHLPTFSYAFTKHPKAEADEIHPRMAHMLSHLTDAERSEPAFVALLTDIVNKTRDSARVIDPLTDKPGDFLQELVRTPSIANPQDVFRDFVTEESLQKLKDQLAKHKSAITHALSYFNLTLLDYKLNQLKVLSASLDLSVIQKAYKESLQELEQCIKKLLEETFSRMRKSLEDGNTSIEDDLRRCSDSIAKLIQLEPLRKKHLPEISDLEDTCATELKRAQLELLDLIRQKQEVFDVVDKQNPAEGVAEQKGDDAKVLTLISPAHAQLAFAQPELTVSRLDKMRLLVVIFKSKTSCVSLADLVDVLEEQYKIACDYLCDIFKESLAEGVRAIQSLEFDRYVREMDRVKFMREHFSTHLDEEALNLGYQNLKRAIFDYSAEYVSMSVALCQQVASSPLNAKEIQAVLDVTAQIQRTEGLARHVDVQPIVVLRADLLKAVVEYLNRLSQRIISACEQESIDFSVLLQLVLEMDQLRSHAEIDYQTTSLYQLSLDSIRRSIRTLKENLDQDVMQWSQAKLLTCDELFGRLTALNAAAIFSDHLSRVYADERGAVLAKVEEAKNRFCQYFKDQTFPLNTYKQLLMGNKAILQLQALLVAHDIYPEIVNAFEQSARIFQEKILAEFERIPGLFQFDETAELSSIRDAIFYLQACENISLVLIKERQSALEGHVRSKIAEYFAVVSSDLKTAFTLILAGPDSDKEIFKTQMQKLRSHLEQLFGFRDFYSENRTERKMMAITDGRVEKIDMYQDLFELRPLQLLEEWCLGETSFCQRMAVTAEAEIKVLAETKNTEEMYGRLKIMRALAAMDQFRAKEATPKFNELALQLENAIRMQNASVVSALRLAAQTAHYEELKKLIETLDARDPAVMKEVDNIKQELIEKFSLMLNVCDARAKLIKSTDLDIFKESIKDFRELHEAAQYLPGEWVALILPRLYPIETRLYQKACDFCGKSIEDYIDVNDFKRAEEALKRVEMMADLFGDMKSATDFSYRERVLENVQKKRRRLVKQLDDSIKRYMPLDLRVLEKIPPLELFSKVEEALEFSDSYASANAALVDSLRAQLMEVLIAIGREADKIEEAQEQLVLIESIRAFLPRPVSSAINDVFKDAKAHVQSVYERFDREIAEGAALGKIRELVNSLIAYARKCQFTHMASVKVSITKLISDAIARFKGDLIKGDLAIVFENLPKIWDDWKFYTDCFGSLTLPVDQVYAKRYSYLYRDETCFKMCNDIKTAVATKLNDILRNIDRVRVDRPDGWKTFATYFDHLMSFLHLRSASSSFYHELVALDNTFDQRTKAAFVKIQEWIKENQDQFKAHIEACNFHELQKVMDVAQEMEGFFAKLVDESKKPFFLGDLVEFKDVMHAAFTYRQMRSELARRVVQWKESVHQPFLHHERTRTENILERNAFYAELSASYKSLKQVRPLGAHIDTAVADVNLLETQSRDHVEQELRKLGDFLQGLLAAIPTDDTKVYADFNIWYDNLRSFIDNVEDAGLNSIAVGLRNAISKKFAEKIVRIQEDARSEADVDKIVIALIKIKSVMIAIPAFKLQIDGLLNEFLKEYKQAKGGAQKIGLLGVKLNEHSNSAVAQRIINEHSAFHGYALSLRNEKTLRFTAADVVAALEGDEINKASLLEQYQVFDKEYWALVESGLMNRQEVQRQIKEKALLIRATVYDRAKVISLMAHVFAWWTLSHAQHYSEAISSEETAGAGAGAGSGSSAPLESKKHYLMQPHAAQVISIFRLLGIEARHAKDSDGGLLSKGKKVVSTVTGGAFFGSSSEASVGLSNHLVQIGTGEGKSVILAMVSTLLALLGYDVDCACYSEYLSGRDYEAFQSLFQAFAVGSFVHYGTFNQLCESFINQHGDVRALVEATAKGTSVQRIAKEPTRREKILLIDEVDVFFNKDFYGNMYRPIAKLSHPAIRVLIDYLWGIRGTPAELRLANVKRLPEYQACLLEFRGYEELIEEAVKTLLYDLKTFESHDYVVVNGRIGYKEQDGLSFEATYGYKTLFAHYKECAAKNISASLLQSKIALYIDCGNFSYAEMPKQYRHIMGVSGTLKTLSKPEQRLLREVYSIRKRTFTPSVYGESNLKFSSDSTHGVIVESAAGYLSAIRNEINARLRSLDGSPTERAVLVFFESTPKLMAFYRSRELHDVKDQVRLMTEEVSAVEKEGLIRQAVTSGSVTLLTREFGRGTDFICYDDRLLNAGGVHVIQTFVSDELSEETQIKGRTARQGNKGSYSMVLLDETLERFDIRSAEIERMKATEKMYSTIDAHRTRFFEGQYPENMRYVDEIRADHLRAQGFVSALVAKDFVHAKAFLIEQNRSVVAAHAEAQTSRTICLMDATGSMSGLLQKSKNTVKVMFERAAAILDENGFSSAFELQFAVYRNYSSQKDLLLQYSTWEFKPANLRAFMDSISTSGGQGHEAVEIGLWHVNQEMGRGEVTQVILIGDMPPNSHAEVASKRGGPGEAYWARTPFAVPTHYTTELEKIREKGIPVHAFYVKDNARVAFSEIATATGGRTAALDIDSDAGAEMLTDLVTEKILENVGGAEYGERLVSAYRAKFARGYVSAAAAAEVGDEFAASAVLRH